MLAEIIGMMMRTYRYLLFSKRPHGSIALTSSKVAQAVFMGIEQDKSNGKALAREIQQQSKGEETEGWFRPLAMIMRTLLTSRQASNIDVALTQSL